MRRHLTNEWLVKIGGGIAAAVLGAYAVALLGLAPSPPRTRPVGDPVERPYRLTDVSASFSGASVTVLYWIAGATPGASESVQVGGRGRGFATQVSTTDANGLLSGQITFSPATAQIEPPFRVTARDPSSGATSRAVVATS